MSPVNLISPEMWTKANNLIAADSRVAYERANPKGRFGLRPKKNRPYRISERAASMVTALGKGDNEKVSLLILNWASL